MQNNSYSQKFKKIPLLLSALFLIFSCSIFYFLYKEINDNQQISEKAQTEWQIEADRRDDIKSLERSIKDINEERALLELHFAQSSNVVPLLDTIERLALSSKVKSEVVSVDILKDNAGLAVDLKTSGSFEAIYKFLLLLENSQYELRFISMDLRKPGSDALVKNIKNSNWEAAFKIQLLSFIP